MSYIGKWKNGELNKLIEFKTKTSAKFINRIQGFLYNFLEN
jgi:hypothetical protein